MIILNYTPLSETVDLKGNLFDLQELRDSIDRALQIGSDVSEPFKFPDGQERVFEIVVLMEKQDKRKR